MRTVPTVLFLSAALAVAPTLGGCTDTGEAPTPDAPQANETAKANETPKANETTQANEAATPKEAAKAAEATKADATSAAKAATWIVYTFPG